MPTPVLMPKQGITVESCIITQWLKKVGDVVKTGDILYSYETDKAAFEVEAETDGTLLAIFFEDGEEVPVLTTVAVIGQAGEEFASLQPNASSAHSAAQQLQEQPSVVQNPLASAAAIGMIPSGDAAPVRISPRAKNIAVHARLDISTLDGTGPQGRIIERDVKAALAQSTPAARLLGDTSRTGTGLGGRVTSYDLLDQPLTMATPGSTQGPRKERLSGVRRAIANAMTHSLSSMAQLTLTTSFDATALQAYRASCKSGGRVMGMQSVTLGDMLLFALSRVLGDHPALNAHLIGEDMFYFEDVHLGVAVDTPRGLLVPTITGANKRSLLGISQEVKRLAAMAIEGKLSPDALQGGTFTLTNLGSLGIEHFTPVINPPQTGILGVGNITLRPREGEHGIEFYPAMGLSLTFDHRAIDGAPAARFLQDLTRALENFPLLLGT